MTGFKVDVFKIERMIKERFFKQEPFIESSQGFRDILNKLSENYIVEIRMDKGRVRCSLINESFDNESFSSIACEADSMELAVCVVALKSIGISEDEYRIK